MVVSPPTRFVWLAASTVALALSASAPAQRASFTLFGQLSASALTPDGSVVVGIALNGTGYEAIRWTAATGMVGLRNRPTDGYRDRAKGVSADGSVVVGTYETPWLNSGNRRDRAFRWTAATGMVDLGEPLGGNALDGVYAHAVSADGRTTVGQSGSQACRWTVDGEPAGLGRLPGGYAFGNASDVSADGSVIVGGSNAAGDTRQAFRWTAATGMVGLGRVGNEGNSGASAVSSDGSVVVGSSSVNWRSEAFRWTAAEGMVGLGDLPGGSVSSNAVDVSDDGSVIVGTGESDTGREPFLWTRRQGMRRLQEVLEEAGLTSAMGSWKVKEVYEVQAEGGLVRVVGYAQDAARNGQSFLATFPLEEATPRLLWTEPGGRAMVWRIDAAPSSPSYSPVYGPFPGWTAKKLDVGRDSRPRLLWERTDGQVSLWTMNSDGTRDRNGEFGPYQGWKVQDMALGGDNRPRVLWKNAEGKASIWTMDTEGSRFDEVRDYGPYEGWEPHALCVGTDGLTRVMWRNTSGLISLWVLNRDGSFASIRDYGPYAGWEAVDLEAGADGQDRVTWRHTDGKVSLWTVQSSGAFTHQDYGPYPWLKYVGLSLGIDNKPRVLWGNIESSTTYLWRIEAPGSFTYQHYGNLSDFAWKPKGLAVPAP